MATDVCAFHREEVNGERRSEEWEGSVACTCLLYTDYVSYGV
jgi:hypothetical protein